MEGFRPKSVEELNAEFAKRIAQRETAKRSEYKPPETKAPPPAPAVPESQIRTQEKPDAPEPPKDGYTISELTEITELFSKTLEEIYSDSPPKESAKEAAPEPEAKAPAAPPPPQAVGEQSQMRWFTPLEDNGAANAAKENRFRTAPLLFEDERLIQESKVALPDTEKKPRKRERTKEHTGELRGAKIFLNIMIFVVLTLSLTLGSVAAAVANPGKFLFGYGLYVSDKYIEGSGVEYNMLLIVKAAEDAHEGNVVLYTARAGSSRLDLALGRDLPDSANIVGIAQRGVPGFGEAADFLVEYWQYCFGAALLVLLILTVLKIIAFGVTSDRRERLNIF